MALVVKLLSENAKLPSKGSMYSVGYDLYSSIDITVKARGKALVPTDISIEMPQGCYGRIAPRSGLAWKNHIDIGAGVIDPDYKGPVGVVMFNHSSEDLEVKKGDRVAQLILEKYVNAPIMERLSDGNSKSSKFKISINQTRGSKGFGSTGR